MNESANFEALTLDSISPAQVNIFELGASYLQLVKLLRLDGHPTFTRPIDPSLYVHRFADRLNLGAKAPAVIATTTKLIQVRRLRRPLGIRAWGLGLIDDCQHHQAECSC